MSRVSGMHASVYLGDGARVECLTYEGRPPILSLAGGGTFLTVSGESSQRVSALDLANARALVAAVATYAAEVERLHAAQSAGQEAGEQDKQDAGPAGAAA